MEDGSGSQRYNTRGLSLDHKPTLSNSVASLDIQSVKDKRWSSSHLVTVPARSDITRGLSLDHKPTLSNSVASLDIQSVKGKWWSGCGLAAILCRFRLAAI
ncbi:hypothetical protein J6590_106438 [Homalodisca vitripennis]|nr:hypothetical protein J6590_106438 [Homalodisca vitripennis]